MEILGIIPARGGSKGLPRKNLALVGGKPLIAWTWEAARAAPSVTRLVVSTDDEPIAELARSAGVEVPFLRPAELANDTAKAVDVILHALGFLEERAGYRPELVLWLQPTSPLRSAEDIEAAVRLRQGHDADAVVSVCEARHHPLWMRLLGAGDRLEPYQGDREPPSRRQELPRVYELNGAVYLIRREVLLRTQTLFPPDTRGYPMPPDRSIDVDTSWDLHLADLLLRARGTTEASQ